MTQENYQQVINRQGQLSEERVQKDVRLHRAADPNIFYFAFNMRDPVVGGHNLKTTQAPPGDLAGGGREAHIDLFSQGNGIPAQFLIPPGIFGYDPDY